MVQRGFIPHVMKTLPTHSSDMLILKCQEDCLRLSSTFRLNPTQQHMYHQHGRLIDEIYSFNWKEISFDASADWTINPFVSSRETRDAMTLPHMSWLNLSVFISRKKNQLSCHRWQPALYLIVFQRADASLSPSDSPSSTHQISELLSPLPLCSH